jgi:benzoyl-CoA reductase/2-hydroxyglutaryl-CoA dehydratase subunit BcrC/BadD/HgdB
MSQMQTPPSRMGGIVKVFSLLARMNQNRAGARCSETLYYRMLEKYFQRIQQARDESRFIAAHTVFVPSEILYAMDIVPMHAETTAWTTGLLNKENASLLSASSELGMATEICSAHRGLAGAFFTHSIIRPDVILWSGLVCDNTAKSGELLMKLNDCPGFFLDHPFQNTPLEETYFHHELQDMVRFLEEQSGRRLDQDRLAGIMSGVNRQIELSREINELRKAIPSPFPSNGFLELLLIHYLFPGQPEALEYLETLRGELREMVAAGRGAVPVERFRLMSLYVPPMHLVGFLGNIARRYGAVSVVEPHLTLWGKASLVTDPDPLRMVARKSFLFPEMCLYGALDERAINVTRDSVKEYNIDGAIAYAHIGCRQSCATIKLFKDMLNDMGIPVLTLDLDILDPTVSPEKEIQEKMEHFLELLEDR